MTCCPNLYLTCKICIREKLWFKYTSLLSEAFLEEQKSQYKGDVKKDDPQRRFLEQHIVTTLLGRCFEWLQHCSNIATPCCSKNRRCESSRVLNITLKDDCKVGITISGWDITTPCWFINGKGWVKSYKTISIVLLTVATHCEHNISYSVARTCTVPSFFITPSILFWWADIVSICS